MFIKKGRKKEGKKERNYEKGLRRKEITKRMEEEKAMKERKKEIRYKIHFEEKC